ncbi:CpsD/CapB family tyrosine-protein kinase [Bacillus sp. B1-b2]|uniref:CpsD/CapB family tyrosine-protein kinase n=1 Tax=Bacillus sp. B1-b2 TaxID=2653201 RepID=UPI0012623124|nr:CpsD/CapB family tyrosine-protein kinase [Bacillus sp. B1-b2]KAB7671737.1 CpsD/CapB family tyrosine-protein kinase [Bacillus sp. B1-b2]
MSPLLKRNSKQENESNLLSHLKPNSPIREQYHTIRATIQLSINENNIKSLVIVSGEEQEGKSTVSANLAITFAEVGKKVLLIDTNFRRPTLHYTFEQNNNIGLSTILVEKSEIEDCVRKSHIENLELLLSGPIPPNPSELLGSPSMEQLLSNLENIYDIIIFDTPAVVSVADSLILSNICDGVLMVVRSNKSDLETVELTRDMLSNTNAYFVGVALNDERISRNKSKNRKMLFR